MKFYRGGQAIIDIQISYHRDIQGCDKRDWASPKEVLLRYSSIHLATRIHPGDPESDIDHRSDRSQCIESRARVFRVSDFAEGWVIIDESSSFPFLLPPSSERWSGVIRNRCEILRRAGQNWRNVRSRIRRQGLESRDDRIYPTILHVTPSRCTSPSSSSPSLRFSYPHFTLPTSSPSLSLLSLLVSLTPVPCSPWAG